MLRINPSTLVNLVTDDADLYDQLLKEYPSHIFEHQIHIDDSGERDESRQYWIEGLRYGLVQEFVVCSGSSVLYRARGTMRQRGVPLRVVSREGIVLN